MTQPSAHIGKKMAKGAAWMIGMRFAMRGIGLVSTIILARLLAPADFGLLALATMLFGVLLVFGEFGFDNYLIKHQDADRSYYDTVWTLTIIRNAILAILLVVVAPFAAGFFDEPRIDTVLYCLAAFALLTGFNNIGVVDFRKEMTFGRDFTYMVVPKIGSFAVTVISAVVWRNYWALVAGMAAAYGFTLIASFVMHPYRPRFSLSRVREVIGFSVWLLLNNILGYFTLKSDEFVIGRLMDTASVGLYSVAHEVSNMPTSELVAPIRRALFPGYAKMVVRPDALRDGFIEVWALVLMFVTPMAFGILLVADYLVPLALGWQWLDAIPLIEVLALFGFFSILASNAGPILLALGRPSTITYLAGMQMSVKLPVLIWAVMAYGAIGAAWAATFATAVTSIVSLLVVLRILRIPPLKLLAASWRTAAATAAMAGVVVQIDLAMTAGHALDEITVKLAAMSVGGAAVYVVVALGLWHLSGRPARSAETAALKLAQPILRRAFVA